MGRRCGGHTLDAVVAFALGDVALGVQVEQVGGGAVGLIANDRAVLVGPVAPRHGELVEQQVGDRLAVVATDAGDRLLVAVARERLNLFEQIVAAPIAELFQKLGRPVGLARRVVDFVGVVEKRPQRADLAAGKGVVELFKIRGEGLAGKMVDDVPFAPRPGPFDLLAVPAGEESIQSPLPSSRGRRPIERPVRGDAIVETDGLA